MTLQSADPELHEILLLEQKRQFSGIELIASENFTSKAVLEALGSVFTNKYSEGYPGARYYGGTQYIDQMETLCIKRALEAFHLDDKEWGVNVQPLSGSPANFAAYTAVLSPHERLMGLDLPSGGHLTHGFYRGGKKVSATSIYFESMPYHLDSNTGLIDYDGLEESATVFSPKLIICGGSAYPREWDYARMRSIADKVGALLLCDMAHISGLVAAQQVLNPFEYCHIVTSTTHKTLRGPRSGMIFYLLDHPMDLKTRISNAVFPSLQGGPHNHQIAALCVQFREVCSPAFNDYIKQVMLNAKCIAKELMAKGYKLVSDGTDNHLILWDLRPLKLTGSKFEALCDSVNITLNKNSVFGDRSALTPGGVRIGTPAMTSRDCTEKHMIQIAEFLHRGILIALEIQKTSGSKLVDFKTALNSDNPDIVTLRSDIEAFSTCLPLPGVTV